MAVDDMTYRLKSGRSAVRPCPWPPAPARESLHL